jgi:histone acetyltransferase (RNA polymerase elongator complex component)
MNIPVFITHAGCKNKCVFCNQRIITGQAADLSAVRETINYYLSRISKTADTEIAFFGGSFTGLERNAMINLLEIAGEYIKRYEFIKGVRLSTRPDYINQEILDILLKYQVKNIELGIQSLFDNVLSVCRRGCTVADCENACKLINLSGIGLTGQIMLGLPGSSREKDIITAERLVRLGVKSARIYPAVVLRDTELYNMHGRGEYEPVSLNEAVYRAKEIKKIFDNNDIKILRMGLCSSDNINLDNCIGPYHPAFGELVEGELLYDKLCADLELIDANDIIIETAKKNISKVIGHSRVNIIKLQAKFSKNIKIVENNDIKEEYNIKMG